MAHPNTGPFLPSYLTFSFCCAIPHAFSVARSQADLQGSSLFQPAAPMISMVLF